jgi:hypothetical protein
MTSRALVSLAPLGVLLATLSCRSLDRFDTPGKAAFCGELVSGPSFHDGFVAVGEPAVLLKMKLKLDTSQLSTFSDNQASRPGMLTSNDAERGLCSAQGQALFEGSPLRSIPQVDHDSISTLTFGEGHDEDFFAWTDSTCQGTMLAIVSLLRKGDVELRLFKPASQPPPDAGPDKRPGFALFYLRRSNDETCGF